MGHLQFTDERADKLRAAGFVARPADTPGRQALLRTLPPDRLTEGRDLRSVVYVFPDMQNCSCLYVGDEVAYARMRAAAAGTLVTDRVLAAPLNVVPGAGLAGL